MRLRADIKKDIDDVKELLSEKNVFLITDDVVLSYYKDLLVCKNKYIMPSGEQHKNISTVEDIIVAMTSSGCNRRTVVVAVGGGVVGDTAGFVSSIFMRGVSWINVPTTLLAQVDSSIGGKTGVDVDGYKNIAGSFHMPTKIVIRTDFLKTLPLREWLCGLGEVIKHAALDKKIYAFLLSDFESIYNRTNENIVKLIELNVRYKESIVRKDFKESGLRKRLNVGHTIGHALERCDNFTQSHGKYVAMGMIIEFKMFEDMVDAQFSGQIIQWCKYICPELPKLDAEKMLVGARADKKNLSSLVSIMLPISHKKVIEMLIEEEDFLRRLA